MSFDIPASMEPEIQRYAQAERISADEALLRLIQAGLDQKQGKPDGRALLGAFSSPEDSAILDVAMDLAKQERVRRNGTTDVDAKGDSR